jgi:hypothetical protein
MKPEQLRLHYAISYRRADKSRIFRREHKLRPKQLIHKTRGAARCRGPHTIRSPYRAMYRVQPSAYRLRRSPQPCALRSLGDFTDIRHDTVADTRCSRNHRALKRCGIIALSERIRSATHTLRRSYAYAWSETCSKRTVIVATCVRSMNLRVFEEATTLHVATASRQSLLRRSARSFSMRPSPARSL